MALIVMGSLSACVEPQNFSDITKVVGDGRLSVNPTVSEATVVTRAESIEGLNEKKLNTLDVFVEHVTDGVGDGTIMKQYHLPLPSDYPFPTDLPATAKTIGDQVQSFLKEYWTKEGLRYGEKYNIYVAVNNTQTRKDAIVNAESLTVTTLMGLKADEVTDGLAVVDATNNISWPWTEEWAHTPSGNIYKQYVSEANVSSVMVGEDLYGFTTSKEFMMDGVLENWTPVAGSKNQVFGKTGENDPNDALILNRAAAKIVLNLKFDADFIKSLTYYMKTEGSITTWVEKPDAEKFSITGAPAWRFYNFAFGAQVFDPGTNYTPVEVHNSATLLRHPYNFDLSASAEQAAQIVTYTYPNKWAAADYSTKAPSLVISVPFLQNGQTEPEYHYYRIPLVQNTVTEIKRNHIYVINATIATRGSELQEDVDEIQDVIYEVLPWNDKDNSAVIENNVESVQHYYFRANPKVYTLRGDGEQSVIINYSKATGTKVNWKLFTYDAQGNQTGVVANNATGAVRAWFYNSDGLFTTAYDDNSDTNWSNSGPTPMGVSIVQSNEGTSGSNGTITVTSTALNNKAIKYIRLRVYLDEAETFQDNIETLYEDIIIRHFPTDNIQNISGSWSSYHSENSSTQNITLGTKNQAEAEAWAAQYGVSYTSHTVTTTDYITYSEWYPNRNTTGYSATNSSSVNAATFRSQLQTNASRQAANSEQNGKMGEDGACYWGTSPRDVTSQSNYNQGNYDYYTTDNQGYINRLYTYNNHYKRTYTHTYSYTQYTVTVPVTLTGGWVDWDASDKANHTSARTYTTTYLNGNNSAGTFNAKAMQDGTMYLLREIHPNNYATVLGEVENLTNNHMYVIQISSTSDKYVLGRPYVNSTTHQSNDNVVSPAFMIASQLGAVTPFTGDNGPANAATHCSRYMEVAQDGTRYTGWRLPTQAEVEVIIGYQFGTIDGVEIPAAYQAIVPVLTGQWYHTLSGQEVEAYPDAGAGSTTKSYLRCVRDLTAKEVDRLNGFDKIQEKYK